MKAYFSTLQGTLQRMLEQPLWMMVLVSVCLSTLPYLHKVIRDIPLAVVDLDHSIASRELIRLLDATDSIRLQSYGEIPAAQAALARRDIHGIFIIPTDFEKKLLRGESVLLPNYGDASNRSVNGLLQRTVQTVTISVSDAINRERLASQGLTAAEIQRLLVPVVVRQEALFNPNQNFAAIVMPGLISVMLQYSLLLSMVRVSVRLREAAGNRQALLPLPQRLGGMTAFLLIWLVLALLLYVIWPALLGYPQKAGPTTWLLIVTPFLIATMTFAQFISLWLPSEEACYLSLTFISTPLFYLAGYSWPPEAMPLWVQWLAALFPSTWAIRAIAELNQMGLALSDIRPDISALLLLALAYLLLAELVQFWRQRKQMMANRNATKSQTNRPG